MGDAIARDERGFIVSGADLLRNGVSPAWTLEREPFLIEPTQLLFEQGGVRSAADRPARSDLDRARNPLVATHDGQRAQPRLFVPVNRE